MNHDKHQGMIVRERKEDSVICNPDNHYIAVTLIIFLSQGTWHSSSYGDIA